MAVESYIGSLISLTSKSEIRYEGILFDLNAQDSTIGLRNVRSFGTEGRKKDGPQISASDKTYDYILFRGSDIKDLLIKPTPVQNASIQNDPAIIQSRYSNPASTSTSLPSVGNETVSGLGSHTVQLEFPQSTFQSGLPVYQPGGHFSSWGTTTNTPTLDGNELPLPMYWQGLYAPSYGLPHLQQAALFRPPPESTVSFQQSLQYPGVNASASMPDITQPSFLPVDNVHSLTSVAFSSTVSPAQTSVLASEITSSHNPLAGVSQSMATNFSSKPMTVSAPTLSYQTSSQNMPTTVGLSNLSITEQSASLVAPDQILTPGHSTGSPPQSLQVSDKNAEVIPNETEKKPLMPESSEQAPKKANEPPSQKPNHSKPNRALQYNQRFNRGRGWGRGNTFSRPVIKFTEDFDFVAMNEKFNKDEVWGHLGKTTGLPQYKEGENDDGKADSDWDNDNLQSHKPEIKPVYVKDAFFDTLSSNTLNQESRGGRTKFSEQLKLDTETFGDFPRQRLNWRGGRGHRGGAQARGSSYYGRGRGYGYVTRGRGYGYVTRGRGYAVTNRVS